MPVVSPIPRSCLVEEPSALSRDMSWECMGLQSKLHGLNDPAILINGKNISSKRKSCFPFCDINVVSSVPQTHHDEEPSASIRN